MRAVLQKFNPSVKNDHSSKRKKIHEYASPYSRNSSLFSIFLDKIKPHGHGRIRNFWKCYQAFKKDSWYKLFERHRFKLIAIQPLLLYAPSEWPIIPIIPVRGRYTPCSSILYLISKDNCPILHIN